jgi:hypothetical protein
MFLTTGVESSFRALIIVEATEFTDPRPTLERSALGNDGTTTFPELLEKDDDEEDDEPPRVDGKLTPVVEPNP